MGRLGIALAVLGLALPQGRAQAQADSDLEMAAATEMPVLEVVGTPEEEQTAPGSAQVIDHETLESSRVFTTAEALRKAVGVNVRDEEGFGLRPNIGIRGLNPTRSTKVSLLEDGIPLAYAPYGDNASYYHPPVDRFDRIEILKGVGQNRFGPQTVGGVINYITPAPPIEFSGGVSITVGNREYLNAQGHLGGRGQRVDLVRKQGDAARDNTHSELNDVNYKAVVGVGAQALTFRANYYTEDSQLTYSGLTDAEYRNFGPRYNPFRHDEFEAERAGASTTHEWRWDGEAALITNLYFSSFDRDWWRQASTTTDGQCGQSFTEARLAGSAVDVEGCNSAQGRLREYRTYGIEPRLTVPHALFGVDNEFEAGLRAHFETQDRVQKNGVAATARDGTILEDNERRTRAYALFAQNRFDFGAFALTPGLRVENVRYERTNRLTGVSGDADLTELIPGLGATWDVGPHSVVYAGAHRGFAPPRTEDLISNSSGVAVDLDAEESWNYELGLRSRPGAGIALEATLFRNDFERQIAVGSIAGGSTPLATGEALYQGAELSGRVDIGVIAGAPHPVFMELAYTFLPTAESETPFIRVDNGEPVSGSAAGKRVPYAPRHLLTAGLGLDTPVGLDARLEAVWVDRQFSDFANSESAPANGNGQAGVIASHAVWNAALNYAIAGTGVALFVTGKNLFDREYIVDRTRGILPGAPALVQAGASYEF